MLGELEGEREFVVGDLEAGTGTVLRLTEGLVDVVLVVAQPTAKALDVAGRAARTAARRGIPVVVLANRVRDEEDAAAVRAALGEHEIVTIPDDPGVLEADRQGLAPIDVAPEGPAVRALVEVARGLAAA